MALPVRARTAIAMLLSIIAAASAAQTSGVIPALVSADDNLSFQLLRAPTSAEPTSATGNVEVNLQTGQAIFELKHATPNSVYDVVYVSSVSNFQLGTLSTTGDGEGYQEATLNAGVYVGVFQIMKTGLVQLLSANVSFTIGLTASVSTTLSSTTTASTSSVTTLSQTQTTIETTNTVQVRVRVEPAFRSISAGAFAKFSVHIQEAKGAANILLVAKGVPSHSVAIFTPSFGIADHDFHSTLTIVTSTDTPTGTFGITVVSIINGDEIDSEVALQITASSTVTTSRTITSISGGSSLTIILGTDVHHFEPNATVALHGHATDNTGNAVGDANVSIQVDGPTGSEIVFVTNLKTDAAGIFQVSFKLQANATTGTYAAFATASKAGFANATTHTTFVVGSSSTPSVVIREVYVTDTGGNRSAVFSAGQTLFVWVIVENDGAASQGVMWVQIRDPNGTPVAVQLQISTLRTGETTKVAFGFTAQSRIAFGLYTASALVSDKLISDGGIFLASADAKFALIG